MKLVAGNSNRPLAEAVAREVQTPLTAAAIQRFSDNEIFVEIQENIRGEDVFVLQSTAAPTNDNLMELLIMIDAIRRGSARRITAVIPYFGYARQERKSAPRSPISAKLVANLLTTAGADRILALDLHSAQIQGFFDIPVDHLNAAPVFARDIRARYPLNDTLVIVSPDVGGVVRARHLATMLGVDLAIIDKRRERAGISEVMNIIGEINNRRCILVDDLVDSAGTLCNAARVLKENGAIDVLAYCSHGVLSGQAVGRIREAPIREMVLSDSILASEAVRNTPTIRQVSIAPLLAEAIVRTSREQSVSNLLGEE